MAGPHIFDNLRLVCGGCFFYLAGEVYMKHGATDGSSVALVCWTLKFKDKIKNRRGCPTATSFSL